MIPSQIHTRKKGTEEDEDDILHEPITAPPPPGKFIRMEGRPSMDRKPSSAGSAYTLAGPAGGGESTPAYIEKAQEQQKLLNEVRCDACSFYQVPAPASAALLFLHSNCVIMTLE